MALQEVDLSSKELNAAFGHLSIDVKDAFPNVLPLEVFTVGGAMIVITLGTRPTTHDVDVSAKLLEAQYAGQYPDIKKTFKDLCAKTFVELRSQDIDLGNDQWLNYAADMFLPTKTGPVRDKALEDNIVLFQNDALIVRSVSFAQTIFQKLKRFSGNDPEDIKAIISHLLSIGKLPKSTPDVVLEYLKTNLLEDRKEVEVKEKVFSQKLATALF